MKLYKVEWEERMTGMVRAMNIEEARELTLQGEVEAHDSELISDVIVYEMEDSKTEEK